VAPPRRSGDGPADAALGRSLEPFGDILGRHGLTGAEEEPLEHDGWSGARLTRIATGPGYVVKRDALAWDWIARATADGPILREAWVASGGLELPPPVWAPYLGAGWDGDAVALLMPDLTGALLPWEAATDLAILDRVLEAMAALHRFDWPASVVQREQWCPLPERILLLSRPAAERYRAAGNPVGDRFIAGWDAFERRADPAVSALIARLSAQPTQLLAALGRLRSTVIHGDLKLANVGPSTDGRVAIVDWQMVAWAPVAIELGWFLVANVASLPLAPPDVLARYRIVADGAGADRGDWEAEVDLACLVGLLLRGWRKGLDAEAGLTLASGIAAADDLDWWGVRALEAADRRL
jgi:Phosphotransferase enzyme family